METCYECGKPAERDHHVVPKVLGGEKTIPLCNACHKRAHGAGSPISYPRLARLANMENVLLRLRPREAAEWCSANGCPAGSTVAGLETLRARGKGPAYYRVGRGISYAVEDLAAWAQGTRVETSDSRNLP